VFVNLSIEKIITLKSNRNFHTQMHQVSSDSLSWTDLSGMKLSQWTALVDCELSPSHSVIFKVFYYKISTFLLPVEAIHL